MSPYSDTTSCNFSPERRGDATSFSTLPIKYLFSYFCTCDYMARNDDDSKKKEVLPLFVSMNALLFSMQYGHASFPCVLQPESIP